MRRIILYIATSLNGKIARADGSVKWLESMPNPDQNDYGYNDFLKSIDTTIMGYNTYQQILDWGIDFPYREKKNFVLTRKKQPVFSEYVEFINSDPIKKLREIKVQNGKNIWLIGGAEVNTLLFNANLIDEIRLFIMPIVIPDGIELLAQMPEQKYLELLENKSYSSGAIELQYRVKNEEG